MGLCNLTSQGNGADQLILIIAKVYFSFSIYFYLKPGTKLLLHTCQQLGVKRFLYCSTMDVVCGNNDIIDGTESTTSIPDSFFFGSYASTKSKAEKLVFDANSKIYD